MYFNGLNFCIQRRALKKQGVGCQAQQKMVEIIRQQVVVRDQVSNTWNVSQFINIGTKSLLLHFILN